MYTGFVPRSNPVFSGRPETSTQSFRFHQNKHLDQVYEYWTQNVAFKSVDRVFLRHFPEIFFYNFFQRLFDLT